MFDFPDDISKTDAVRITELDIAMFHDESRKPIYFGVKMSKVKVTSNKNSVGVVHSSYHRFILHCVGT